jgi:hypothetical protein
MTCTQCGADVEPTAKTCASCGTRILPPPPPRWPPRPAATKTPPAEPSPAPEAEPTTISLPESAPAPAPAAASASGSAQWTTTHPAGVKTAARPAATIHLPDTPASRPTQPVAPPVPVVPAAGATPAPPISELKTVAAGLQAQKTAAAGRRRARELTRSSVGLFIIRILAALAILALSVTSFIEVKKTHPSETLFKWGTLEVTPKSETAYKAELVVLILLALFSLLAFLSRAAASRFFAFLLGVTMMGIVVGNILDLHTSNEFLTYFMIQNYFITTWICLGLAFLCALSSFWTATTMAQLRAIVVSGVTITALTVAFIWSVAPDYTLSIARFAAS